MFINFGFQIWLSCGQCSEYFPTAMLFEREESLFFFSDLVQLWGMQYLLPIGGLTSRTSTI